ncbi:ROK family protein [Corallincola spongiicola]|uniref:ROK family protein n=1 Tax=Corallincola spongiicola TaxID=2520508 RepID=UPI001A933BC3|nr:ROK family protein [Corallincola spongiicola]
MSGAALRLGIDLGGTKIEIIALDSNGIELYRQRMMTVKGDYDATLSVIKQLVLEAESVLGQQGTVGVGIPGTISEVTGRVKNANSTCLIGQPLREDLAQQLSREIRVANDADCFVSSEAGDGAGAGYDSVFGVILGTGVGAGVSVHGRLLPSPNGVAGEWGHNPMPWIDDAQRTAVGRCYCGQQGCIEQFLSGPALAARCFRETGRQLSAKELAMALNSDPAAESVFKRYVLDFCKGLAHVINLLDPQVIVLGGGVSNIDRLYDLIPDSLGDYVFGGECSTPIVKNRHGDSSGVRGAAWLWP